MKLYVLLVAITLMQMCDVNGQTPSRSGGRYSRRKGNSRRNAGRTDTSSARLPAFIARAFGGGSDNTEEGRQHKSSRPFVTVSGDSWTPSIRRSPFVTANRAIFPGNGPFAPGSSTPRRRFVRKNNSRPSKVSIALASSSPLVKTSPTVQSILPSSALMLSSAAIPFLRKRPGNRGALATPPQSLEGWVSFPTESPIFATTKYTPTIKNKAGVCGNIQSYGIKCSERMDQCSNDGHCPGSTRCCMVGECGYLCVKPKATSGVPKKKWGLASNVLKRQREADLILESSTTSNGLKLDDITLKGGKM